MSPELERLIKLQHLESRIDEARRATAAHPARVEAADARLQGATSALEAAKARLQANNDARRALEKEVALYQGRLTKFRDQQSAVKTNREYQALGHEIETAQQELSAAEEKVLERMMEADAIAAEIKQAEAAVAAERKDVEAEKKELAAEIADVEAALQKATEARAKLIAEIAPPLLATFAQVARIRKGVAVTTATRDGLCSLCHVRLRPQVFQLVRRNEDIIQCDSCQRILYYIPPPPPVEHAIVRTS